MIVLLALHVFIAPAQVKKKRNFIKRDLEFSVVSGISTNGLHSGWYVNKYSFAVFSSLAAANRYFQFAGISTLNLQYVTGIQIAGIANVVGSNTYINMSLGEERAMMREGVESNMTGIQVAGLLNVVRDNMRGWQMSGGVNFVHDDAYALQMAGIANMVGGTLVGVQIAGLTNSALKGSSGVQLALLSNLNNGVMQGLQISMVNKAWTIKGRHSDPPSPITGWQIGLVNMASKMDGLQLGLVNRTRSFRGVQIGLINLFSTAAPKNNGKAGVPIGLINIGSRGGHQRVYMSELFRYNFEVATGNCYNCSRTESTMPLHDRTKKLNQNALIFTFNPEELREGDRPYWSLGYGFERLHYNKNSMSKGDFNNEKKFISYGLKFQHLSYERQIARKLSLLTKLNLTYGYKIRNKLWTFYLFGSATANAYFADVQERPNRDGLATYSQDRYALWPGYELGIHIY